MCNRLDKIACSGALNAITPCRHLPLTTSFADAGYDSKTSAIEEQAELGKMLDE